MEKILAQPTDIDILFIDDNSPDGTGALAEELSRKIPRVKVLHRKNKQGLGMAYSDGFRWALDNGYDVILQMDADLSHDPHEIPVFLRAIREYDAVFGSRYFHGVRVYNWSFRRLMLSKFSNEFIRLVLGLPCTDTTTAYKCFRREVIASVDFGRFRGRQNAFLIELVDATVKRGFKTKEIPFMFIERATGESKMNWGVAWESLATVFRLFVLGLVVRYPARKKSSGNEIRVPLKVN